MNILGKTCLPTGKTKIVGVFGYPIAHTLSPVMHNAAFKYLDLDFIYLPFEIKPEDLKSCVKSILDFNIYGVNLTIPHKESVIPYLDKISKEAKLIGAVNTIENKGGKLIGHNTDASGFIRSLREAGVNVKNKIVLLVGAGGSAKAVAFALALNGAKEIYITNRTLRKAEDLADSILKNTTLKRVVPLILEKYHLKSVLDNVDIIINCTSVGMKKNDPLLIPIDVLKRKMVVYDLIYSPAETKLLKLAKKKGCITINGASMLLYQGAIAFEIWTKRKAPIEVMRKALFSRL